MTRISSKRSNMKRDIGYEKGTNRRGERERKREQFGDRNKRGYFLDRRSHSAAMKITDKRYFISPINQTWDKERAAQEHENARSVRWKINQEGERRERKSRRHLEKHPRIVANRIARERSAQYQTNVYIYIYIPLLFPRGQNANFSKARKYPPW